MVLLAWLKDEPRFANSFSFNFNLGQQPQDAFAVVYHQEEPLSQGLLAEAPWRFQQLDGSGTSHVAGAVAYAFIFRDRVMQRMPPKGPMDARR